MADQAPLSAEFSLKIGGTPRRLVSRTRDLVLRKKDDPKLAEPRGVSQPPAGAVGRGRGASAQELLPPLENQQSHPLIARDAAVLVYRMASEHGGPVGRSTYGFTGGRHTERPSTHTPVRDSDQGLSVAENE